MVLLAILFSLPVQAHELIVGDRAVRSNPSDYPFTCDVVVTESQSGEDTTNGCSGTLVAPNKIITAGHCFTRDFILNRGSIVVRCGGNYLSRVIKVDLPDRANWGYNASADRYVPKTEMDVAVLTLSQSSALPAVAVETSESEFFGEDSPQGLKLLEGVQCYVAGYGVNPKGNLGALYTAKLNSDQIHFRKGVIEFAEKTGGQLKTSVDHGDSGGSLICEGAGRPATLVGVTVSIQLDPRTQLRILNQFAPTWTNQL